MSYILEALKKSQQARELGKVPTLDTTGMFEEDKAEPVRSIWPMVATGLAASAVLIALYAAFRAPAPEPSPNLNDAPPVSDPAVPPHVQIEPRPLELEDMGGLSVARRPVIPEVIPASTVPFAAPEPLVEPPPPKRARQPVDSVSFRDEDPGAGAYSSDQGDYEAELELQRQLDAESQWEDYEYEEPIDPPTPVPRDLIADIEAFKKQVGLDRGSAPAKRSANPAADPTLLRLTPQQRADLPPYLMSVHVFDSVQEKRFVLINGVKYREGGRTREGIKVDQILKDGAVLSFQGNPFFVHR